MKPKEEKIPGMTQFTMRYASDDEGLTWGILKNLHFGEVRLSALLTCVEEKKLHELKLYPRMGDIDGTNNLLI